MKKIFTIFWEKMRVVAGSKNCTPSEVDYKNVQRKLNFDILGAISSSYAYTSKYDPAIFVALRE